MNTISISALQKNYAAELGRILRPQKNPKYAVLDLYSGAGGLSLGLEAAGFKVTGVDSDLNCCTTYNSNLKGICVNEFITPKYDFPDADIIVGGPPCQPFSVHGKQFGKHDSRNGIPSFISAIKKIRPKIWIFENVRGVLYRNKEYFTSSMKRLAKLGYHVSIDVINCADYGVPQNRERVIAVGHHGNFEYPISLDGRITVREALKNIPAAKRERPSYLTKSMDKYIAVYEKASQCRPRDLNPKKPARTLTCRNLGGYSSDMHRIKMRNGKRRLLYKIEASRLQGFPDWFEFSGSWHSKMNQIGNAVPPLLAMTLGIQIRKCIESTSVL